MKLGKINVLLLIGSFVLCGCAVMKETGSNCRKAPKTDKEILISRTLRRAVLDEKDIPDYGLIKNKKRIFLSNRVVLFWQKTAPSDTINICAIPADKNVKIILATLDEIQRLADIENDFLYLSFGKIEIEGKIAKVEIATQWAVSRKNYGKKVYMSGGGYELQFIQENGKWRFDKIGKTWIS